MLLITNTAIHTPGRRIDGGAVLVDAGRIVDVGSAADIDARVRLKPDPTMHVIDASGLNLVPGFIDLQFNGALGHDFTDDPTAIWRVAAQLPRYGVTAFLPTIISSPIGTIAAAQAVVTTGRPAGFRGSAPLGLHLEGPFLNPQKKGAHNPSYLRAPSLHAAAEWSPATGVRLVTLAPELPGALDVVEALSARGVLVSAGHTMATYDQAVRGFGAGIRYGTHLFNAMPALHHRDPGLPGALLTDARACVGFIADGVHTHPAVVSLVWQAIGPARLSLVSDAMAALGMPAGTHRLGDFEVHVDARSARLADGTLAGSILSLDQAIRNVMAFAGCPLDAVLPTVTTTPARLLGLEHERGQIAPGFVADLVLLSPDHQVRATIAAGELVYQAS